MFREVRISCGGKNTCHSLPPRSLVAWNEKEGHYHKRHQQGEGSEKSQVQTKPLPCPKGQIAHYAVVC